MTWRSHYVLCDIPYRADRKILFTGMLRLRITDFAYTIELNSDRLLKIQVGAFSYFLWDFVIKGTPFLHSAVFVCRNPILFRIICKGSDISAIDHLTWHRTALFYALRNLNISALQTLIDAKMEIGIGTGQCDVKRCSPFIYCLQMGDLHPVKCLLDNGTWVHRTFAAEYASSPEFVLRECETDCLRLLRRGASNQVNLLITGIGMIIERQRIIFHPLVRGDSLATRFFGGSEL